MLYILTYLNVDDVRFSAICNGLDEAIKDIQTEVRDLDIDEKDKKIRCEAAEKGNKSI